MYARQPAIAGRPLNFVYFGGGTPSFLSTQQLEGLVKRLTAVTPWNHAEEITFECEPGTLTEHKLKAIRRMGVTRFTRDRKSTRLNSSHQIISYAVFCLKKKKQTSAD